LPDYKRKPPKTEEFDLRDLFAAFAVVGWLANNKQLRPKDTANMAYDIADAMIEAKYANRDEIRTGNRRMA
jgi:hypothetical protein